MFFLHFPPVVEVYLTPDVTANKQLSLFQTAEQYYRETGIQPMETRRVKFTSLDGLLNVGVFLRPFNVNTEPLAFLTVFI